ncbi:MAG: alpha/beta fold hydrolase [Desulfovibrio sp.]|nr:alpha/beta fold hydrolase [Desulfovibrio sp.]
MSILIIAALALLSVCMILALCGSLLYWYERLNAPEAHIPQPRTGIFPCLFLYGTILGSYILCLLTLIFSPLCRLRIAAVNKRASTAPPLIFIHGIYNSAAVWLYFNRRLRKAGFACRAFSYSSFLTSPQAAVRSLDDYVETIEAAFPGHKPLFVCHSMGGLIVRHWLLEHKNRRRAGGVLTLGTPHGGSKIAALAPGKLVKHLLPGAAFIRVLHDALPEEVPCTSVISTTDEAVLPASSLLPPQGWSVRVTHSLGHIAMLFCPGVADIAIQELQELIRKITDHRQRS